MRLNEGHPFDSTGHHNKGTTSPSSSSYGDIQHNHHQTSPHIRTSQDPSVSHGGVSESRNPHHRTSGDPYSHRTHYRDPTSRLWDTPRVFRRCSLWQDSTQNLSLLTTPTDSSQHVNT
ncbi:hypothetical protein Pmani_026900 [Petrolisthes manimaculis]|uniref:Uncharacterized protein n=1 Tax=Petrolisthes manimaculis TaxID=1843537 RepID=A0AAE1P2L5_9EUCA|nr:hypothetical protein Pmani_026900 [Petrolisthes manimaculis]